MSVSPSPDPFTSETVSPCRAVRGQIGVPSDKSISHRAAILGSISEGDTRIQNFLRADDCLATVNAMRMLGVKATEQQNAVIEVQGRGLHGLREPAGVIDCGNSGTTIDRKSVV